METHFGARDGHCQHDTDHGAAFAKMPGWRNLWAWKEVWRAPGSWHPQEMEANPASPLPCFCCRFPGQENGENLPKHALQPSQVAAACPEEGEDEHRRMGMERGARGQDRGTDGQTDRRTPRCSDPSAREWEQERFRGGLKEHLIPRRTLWKGALETTGSWIDPSSLNCSPHLLILP